MTIRSNHAVLRRIQPAIAAILLLLTLAACDGAPTGQQTLIAFEEEIETRRAVLYTTATAEIETILLTLDVSVIQRTRVHNQGLAIRTTLEARGITVEMPPTPVPDTPTPEPEAFQPPPDPVDPVDPDAPPTEIQVTPFATATDPAPPTAPPTLTPAFPTNLRQITLSPAVRDDDCATASVTEFSTDATIIYIVARAFDIAPGTELASVWERKGEQLARFTFSPDFRINDACIWFFADTTDFDFTPAQYTVRLQIDGEDAAPPTPFTISGDGG